MSIIKLKKYDFGFSRIPIYEKKILEKEKINIREYNLIDYIKKQDGVSIFRDIILYLLQTLEKYGNFTGKGEYITIESEGVIRLTLYCNLVEENPYNQINKIKENFKCKLYEK